MRWQNDMNNQDQKPSTIINTSQGSYRVIVGRGVIDDLGIELSKIGQTGRAFLIADEVMFPNPVRRAHEALERGGFKTHVLALELGEFNKNLDTVHTVYKWLAELHVERNDIIVAMGGGVTGDLVGYAAATWLRGVAIVHVPTSLAAMVDSSIGGKTGVNMPAGKNLIGAFHQPKLVVQDIEHLKTLPPREMAAGWAEAIKHGLILDSRLLDKFESMAKKMNTLEGEEPVNAIRRSVAIKGQVISSDELETGNQRILLNYGHTIGHAIETVTGYETFLHGEAVAIGMTAAAEIAHRIGLIKSDLVVRQKSILESFKLPTTADNLDVNALISATKSDKKSRGGTIRWVLLEGPGKATTRENIPDAVVLDSLGSILS